MGVNPPLAQPAAVPKPAALVPWSHSANPGCSQGGTAHPLGRVQSQAIPGCVSAARAAAVISVAGCLKREGTS